MQGVLKDIEFDIQEIEKIEDGKRYHVSIKVPMSVGWIERMKFIVESQNERKAFQMKHSKNEDDMVYFETDVDLPTKAIYHYYFSFETNKNFKYFKKENLTGDSNISPQEKWKMSVNFEVPQWAKGKIMYHIFVDRFNKGGKAKLEPMERRTIHDNWDEEMLIGPNKDGIWNADFYGGNLKGIEEKLDYIKSLGVSILYLSPIVWSQSNHRYDASDYEKVDPYAGSNEDLKSLCDKAHEMGMKVVLDAVFNHTGNDSKYFNELGTFDELGAYQSKDSKYYPFYRKYVTDNATYFDYWWGMPNLPVCDGNNNEWQQYIYGEGGIIDKWFELGIDGLRLDVADELTDEFIEGIRKAVKRNKEDGFILGEVWDNPMHKGRGFIESGKGMDSVMNYHLIDALIRYFKYGYKDGLNRVIEEIKTEYPEDTIHSLMNFTSTHDISRAINIFGSNDMQVFGEWAWNVNNDDRNWQAHYQLSKEDYERGKALYEAYVFTLAFLPGILSIFYGDEIGLQGMGNLANRKTFDWNNIDRELLTFFQKIGKIRNENSFLESAGLDVIDVGDQLFTFERKTDDESAIITVNRTNDTQKLILPERFEEHLDAYSLKDSTKDEIKPYGGLVLKKVRRRS